MDHLDVRESALAAIGNTPVVRLRKVAPEGSADEALLVEAEALAQEAMRLE